MDDNSFNQLLLSEGDLDDSFFEENPSAAYDPIFISGDPQGRDIVDLTNMLTHGSHPETRHHASALFTNVAGSVVFHHIALFENEAGLDVFRELADAVRGCSQYRMELNDGVQLDIRKLGQKGVELGAHAFIVHWLSTVDHYRIETSWVVISASGVLSFINARTPDRSEVYRLSQISFDRISSL